MLTKSPYQEDFKDLLHLIQLMLVIPVTSAQCERVFSAQNRIKSDCRSSLATQTVEHLIRISSDGPSLDDFDTESVARCWMNNSKRPRRIQYTAWPED
ncbi:zinc finger protein 862-like [Saccoglossus kowalevskii]